jgi:transcriptional regulator with XRE-family HTH domain
VAEAEDVALGGAIRRRREGMGMSQKEMADRVGMAAAVYSRIELGNRPVRATELRDVAAVLGVPMETLIREVSPLTPEQQVESAAARRDAAYVALMEYGSALVDAVRAVEDSEHGAVMEHDHFITNAAELAAWMQQSQPPFVGVKAPENAIPAVRQAITKIAESVSVYTLKAVDNG